MFLTALKTALWSVGREKKRREVNDKGGKNSICLVVYGSSVALPS